MSNVIVIADPNAARPKRTQGPRRNGHAHSTADFRRMLSDLKLRPPTQRAFLRRLLQRAAMHGAAHDFLAATPAVTTLATHT